MFAGFACSLGGEGFRGSLRKPNFALRMPCRELLYLLFWKCFHFHEQTLELQIHNRTQVSAQNPGVENHMSQSLKWSEEFYFGQNTPLVSKADQLPAMTDWLQAGQLVAERDNQHFQLRVR